MDNPFLATKGGAQGPQGGPMNFVQFMMQHKGENPDELLQKTMSSFNINQQQLNMVQEKAKQIESQFVGFKSMFGF